MAFPSKRSRQVALVTGGAGFTGRYAARALDAAGFDVHTWGHAGSVGSVNLLDPDGVRAALAALQPDVVVHLAAIAFVAHDDVDELYRVNVVGARNLLSALAGQPHRPTHVILASSANVYGNAEGVVDEAVRPSPQNDYAVSKLAMEYMAHLWSGKLPITITRPFNYSGVGQAPMFLLPKIVSHFKRGERTIELGNLDVSRDFYDVRGVAEVYARLACSTPGGVVNICSGVEYSLQDIIGMMERIAGYRIGVEVNPAFVRDNEVKRLRGDPTRLVQRIGDLPRFALDETLSWMFHTP